jgi:hypothetical protein
MKIKLRIASRMFISLLLSGLTIGSVGFAERRLPYSSARDNVTDAISFPGFLIARIFYPEGVHTGRGAPDWGVVFLCSNLFFYALVWLAILAAANVPKTRGVAA